MSHYRHALACCGALLLSACAVLTPAPQTTAADELEALFKSEWQRSLKENPVTASALGDRRYNGQWPDLSLDAIEASHAADLDALEAVRAIDTSGLNAEQALNHRLFENQLALQVEGHAYGQFLIPLNQRGGVQTLDELTGRLRFSQRQDYLDWIARLQALGRYVDQHIALMRAGISAEIVPPKVIMERVAPQIEKQLVARPEGSGFYAPFNKFPDSFSEAERVELANSGRAAIEEVVLPAYRRFAEFFNDAYLPACRSSRSSSVSMSVTSLPPAALASCSFLRSPMVFSLKVLASGTRRLCRSICCSLKHSFPVSSHTHTFSSSDTCENAWKPVSSPCTSASRCEKKSLPVWSQRSTMPCSSFSAAAVLETMVR